MTSSAIFNQKTGANRRRFHIQGILKRKWRRNDEDEECHENTILCVDGVPMDVIAAAVAGNAGPQALVPEEIVTVPASAVVGAIVGVVGFVTN